MRFQTSNGEVGMAVMIHGKEVDEFPHGDKTYLWAREGTEYSIVVWNFTSGRVEVVVTVDGLDILKGLTGDFRTQKGYVIGARQKPEAIPGFRLDGDRAARFTFGAPGDTYAALTHRPNNIGVIGAAFFVERPTSPPPVFRGFGNQTFGGGMTLGGDVTRGGPSIGTSFGREVGFHTGTTTFTRANPTIPDALLVLHYETKERLRQMGIDVDRRPLPQVATGPNPFPGSADGCQPPDGWRPRRR